MNKTLLTLALAAAQMLAVNAFAQVKGEVDPAQSKAIPAAKATPTEKAAAKAARKAEGAKAAKTAMPGDAKPESVGVAKAATKEERKAAAAKRKTETAAAVKKGEIPANKP
jgi:NADH-quinone oxidoreductase subunit C/WASH complex subunit FAM21